MAEEGREREGAEAGVLARRTEEVIVVRREAEAAMEAVAADCSALQEALGRARREALAAARRSEEALRALEWRVSEGASREAAERERGAAVEG